MEDRETVRMRKYGENKTTRIIMATVPHVTSGLGLRKFQADGFLLTRVYITCLAQDIRRSVSNLKSHFCANNDPPIDVIMKDLNTFHTLTSCLLRIVLTLTNRVFRVVTLLDWKKFTDILMDRKVFIFHYTAWLGKRRNLPVDTM